MQKRIYEIDLDIKKSNQIPYIEVVTGDKGTNIFKITLKDADKIYPLTDTIVTIVFNKEDKTTVVQSSEDNDLPITVIDNIINCILKTNTTAKDGRVRSEVIVSNLQGNVLTSQKFQFYVRKSLMNDEVIESTNEFPLLLKLISKVDALVSEQIEMVETELERETNEEARKLLHEQLLQLKTNLENLKDAVEETNESIALNENTRELSEKDRKDNEVLREQLKTQLEALQVDLEGLVTNATDTIDTTNQAATNADSKANLANTAATNANAISLAIEALGVLLDQAESLRVTEEDKRKTNEAARVLAETGRMDLINSKASQADFTAHKEDYANLVTEVNNKANKVQEGWITPTLLNGATTTGLLYRKNEIGQLEMKGRIVVINTSTFMILPSAYKPSTGKILLVKNNIPGTADAGTLYIDVLGNCSIGTGASTRMLDLVIAL